MIEEIIRRGMSYPERDEIFLEPILHEIDREADYIKADSIYRFYRAAGEIFREWWGSKPVGVLEIGVRFGYSAYALLAGLGAPAKYVGLDTEEYVHDSNAIAARNLGHPEERSILKVNSQYVKDVRDYLPPDFCVAHVDGNHTTSGALFDMHVAWRFLPEGGMMLVDDILHCPEVCRAMRMFTAMHRVAAPTILTHRGLAVIRK